MTFKIAVDKITYVLIAVFEVVSPLTVAFTVAEFSFVSCAVVKFEHALTVRIAVRIDFACVGA